MHNGPQIWITKYGVMLLTGDSSPIRQVFRLKSGKLRPMGTLGGTRRNFLVGFD